MTWIEQFFDISLFWFWLFFFLLISSIWILQFSYLWFEFCIDQLGLWVLMWWRSIWRKRFSLNWRNDLSLCCTCTPMFKGARISLESQPYDLFMMRFRSTLRRIWRPCISSILAFNPDSSSQPLAASCSAEGKLHLSLCISHSIYIIYRNTC